MRAFIFDTETTGLVKNPLVPLDRQPKIIEFFGQLVDLSTGQVIDELEFLANPKALLEPVITRITGLTDDDLKDQPTFTFYATEVKRHIEEADAVLAHNLSFDLAMVNVDMKRAGVNFRWPERLICTVEETEWLKSHRLSLTALHEYLFGEPFKGAHRARVDVEALTNCAVELFKRGYL